MKSEKQIREEHALLFTSMEKIVEDLDRYHTIRGDTGNLLNIEHLARAAVKRVTKSSGPR